MYCREFRRLAVIAGLLLVTTLPVLAKDGKLRVSVQPRQAYVFVDGTPYGVSSKAIRIAPGNHKIAVYNYGFKPQEREISIPDGGFTRAEFQLEPIAKAISGPWGRIQIESASRSAILLNGKTPDYFVGHGDEFNHGGLFLPCCKQQLVVPAGTHLVTILDKDRVVWSGTVNVAPNQRVIINAAKGSQKVQPWDKGSTIASLPRFQAGTASAIVAIAPVTANLTAQQAKIDCGETTHLNWTAGDSVEQVISSEADKMPQQGEGGEVAVQPKKTTAYTLQASGPGGSATSDATVNVNTAVQSSLQASPAEVRYRRIGDKVIEDGSTNLTWTSSNANAVAIQPLGTVKSDDRQTVKVLPDQQGNGPVNEVKTYTLTATNECGGTDTQTASVRIIGSIEAIPEVSLSSVFFPTGQPNQRHPEVGLVQSQQEVLARAAEEFKKYLEYQPDAKLSIVANTDERDSKARNQSLSQRRAEVVKAYLTFVGIPEDKIETVAQGKDQPLNADTVKSLNEQNPNKPDKSLGSFQDLVWAYNRRVDIVLLPKQERSVQYFPGAAPEAKVLFDNGWPEQAEIITLAAQKVRLPVESDASQNHK
jgi:outer membrane protein OmpA-like peptidoglycan-associated protein